MARINKSQFAILGSLSIKPMSAYEIKQFIHRSVSLFWTEGEAQLYPTLKNLKIKKWVIYREMPATKAGMKKIYKLTKLGRIALLNWLQSKTDRAVFRNELLLKVFFGPSQPIENNIAMLESEKKELELTLSVLETIKDGLKEKNICIERLPYIEITLDYGLKALQAEIAWCQASIRKLNIMQ